MSKLVMNRSPCGPRTGAAATPGRVWPFAAAMLVSCGGAPEVELDLGEATATSEAGGALEISAVLAREPDEVVTVYAVSSDESEGRVSDPIQFDGLDWDHPQTLTVTGVDDDAHDGDVRYRVAFYARTGQEQPRLLASLALTNVDDELMRFDLIGDLPGGEQASHLADLSAAGDVVVGWSAGANGDEAVRWTVQEGLVSLGGASSRAQAVSPDGRIVVGSVHEPSYEGGRAGARWIDGQEPELLEGPRIPGGGPISMMFVDGKAVRDDGQVYGTCIQYGAYGEPLACLFSEPGSVQTFGFGHLFAADVAGNVAGTRRSERHAPSQSAATFNGATLPYPDAAPCSASMGGCLAEARDFARSGALVVGTAHVPLAGADSAFFDTAFTFDQEHGAQSLPDLPGGARASGAYAVSPDERLVAGFASDASGEQAVLWVEGVPTLLADLLNAAGGALPAGFRLRDVRALSADGRTFAGNGTNAAGAPEGYRLVLPRAP